MSTQKHTYKQKLDHDIFLCGQGNKVTLLNNRNRTYTKKNFQTIQKHRTRGEKEVEQEVRNNLSITLLANTLNIFRQDNDL